MVIQKDQVKGIMPILSPALNPSRQGREVNLPLTCALEWKADLFVTSDRNQFNATIRAGLQAEYLGRPGA